MPRTLAPISSLRTSSEAESQAIIGLPDAAHLPVYEHHGLRRTFNDPTPVRFLCAGLSTAQIDALTRRHATAAEPVTRLWTGPSARSTGPSPAPDTPWGC
jgi:hypothetical protein